MDAVDWFLGQLLSGRGDGVCAELDPEPWGGLDMVAQYTRSGISDPDQRRAERTGRVDRKSFGDECEHAWRDFGHQPGMHLWWRPVGRAHLWSARRAHFALRTAEQQTLASVQGIGWRTHTVNVGGRNFTLNNTVAAKSSFPGSAEVAARSARDYKGQFAEKTAGLRARVLDRLIELVDEAGIPILCVSGINSFRRACARITSPDQRSLRFLVRGTRRANAIMTAVDQAGNTVARYRLADKGRRLEWKSYWNVEIPVEITVHPDWELTEERVLAIGISVPWLASYFETITGG